jgi:hypothetical protein
MASVSFPACPRLGTGLPEVNLGVDVIDPGERNEVMLVFATKC